MTNEELIERFYEGDQAALDELYRCNTSYIRRLVKEILHKYEQYISVDVERKELFQIASIEFVERIKKKEYNAEKGKLLTYITPYLKASMLNYMGRNSSLFPMSGKTFILIAKCRALNKKWLPDEEIAHRLGITPQLVRAYLNFSFYHSVIVNGDTEEIGCVSECTLTAKERHPDDIVYRKWCRIYTRELFEQLSKREKYVIGSYYGVFGYDKMTAEGIGEMLTKTRDAVMKDIDTILLKLREIYYEDSNLYRWRRAHRLVWDATGE